MRFSAIICIIGIIIFAVPLFFIFQNIINSFKLAADKDDKVASTAPSIFLIFFNVVCTALIIFGFIFFVWKLITIKSTDTSSSSSSSSAPPPVVVSPSGMPPYTPIPTLPVPASSSPIFVPVAEEKIIDIPRNIVTVHKGNAISTLSPKDSREVRDLIEKIRNYNGKNILDISG